MSEQDSVNGQRERTLLRNGKLSIRKVLMRAAMSLARNIVPILLAMVGPVVVLTLISEIFRGEFSVASIAVSYIAMVLLWVGFASVLHARFLDRQHSPPPWRVLIWSRAQLDFLFGILKITGVLILMGVVVGILSFVAGPLAQLVGLVVASFVWSRLAMVFPSASVGKPLALEDSWGLTSHARGRVFVLLGSLYIVSQFYVSLTLSLPLLYGSGWHIHATSAALLFGGAAVVVSILSAAYQGLVEMRPPDVRETYLPQHGSGLADAF